MKNNLTILSFLALSFCSFITEKIFGGSEVERDPNISILAEEKINASELRELKEKQAMEILMNEIRLLSLKIEILEQRQKNENIKQEKEPIETATEKTATKIEASTAEIKNTKRKYWEKIKKLGSVLANLGFNGTLLGATLANFIIIFINSWLSNLNLLKNKIPNYSNSSPQGDNCCCCCPCNPLQNHAGINQPSPTDAKLPNGIPTSDELKTQLQDYLSSDPATQEELIKKMMELHGQLPQTSSWWNSIPSIFAKHLINYSIQIFMFLLLKQFTYPNPIK